MKRADLRWFDAIERRARSGGGGGDPLNETETAARPAPVAHELPPYHAAQEPISPWALSMLAALVIALVGAVVIAHRDLSAVSARITARDAAIAAEHRCAVPARDGDRVVLDVVNRGGQLVATCLPVTDWREPERAAR